MKQIPQFFHFFGVWLFIELFASFRCCCVGFVSSVGGESERREVCNTMPFSIRANRVFQCRQRICEVVNAQRKTLSVQQSCMGLAALYIFRSCSSTQNNYSQNALSSFSSQWAKNCCCFLLWFGCIACVYKYMHILRAVKRRGKITFVKNIICFPIKIG